MPPSPAAQKAHALPNEHPSVVHYIAGKAYEQENRQGDALAEFQMFLKEEPNGPRADHVRSDIAKMQKSQASVRIARQRPAKRRYAVRLIRLRVMPAGHRSQICHGYASGFLSFTAPLLASRNSRSWST